MEASWMPAAGLGLLLAYFLIGAFFNAVAEGMSGYGRTEGDAGWMIFLWPLIVGGALIFWTVVQLFSLAYAAGLWLGKTIGGRGK